MMWRTAYLAAPIPNQLQVNTHQVWHPLHLCCRAPLIALLTSQHNYERAEEFWPERWELEGQQTAGSGAAEGPTPLGNAALLNKTYLPFSDGPRDCIGQNLAVMEARAVLATVVGRFKLAVASRMGDRGAVRSQVGVGVHGGRWVGCMWFDAEPGACGVLPVSTNPTASSPPCSAGGDEAYSAVQEWHAHQAGGAAVKRHGCSAVLAAALPCTCTCMVSARLFI